MTNYFRKAILGVGIVFIFSLLAMFAAYFFRLIIARNLSTEDFGLFYAVLSLVTLAYTFHDPGLKSALIKMIPEFAVEKNISRINTVISQTFVVWFFLSGIFTIIFCIAAPFIAERFFNAPQSATIIILLSIGFLLQSFDYLVGYVAQGFQKMTIYGAIDFTRAISFLITAIIGFTIYPNNILVPAFAYLINPIILSIIYLPIFKIKLFPEFSTKNWFDSKLLKQMMYFGIPVTISSIAYTFFQQSSILILTYFGTLADVGLLNVALPTAGLVVTLSSAVALVIFPLTSELWTEKHTKHLKEGVELLYRYAILTALPIVLTLFFFSELCIKLLFGEQYMLASPALQILVIGTIFWILATINFQILAGIGKSKEPLKLMIIVNGFNIILNVALVYFFGLIGSAIAMTGSYLLCTGISIFILKKYIPVKVPVLTWSKNIIAGAFFLISAALAKNSIVIANQYIEAIIVIAISGTIYLAMLFILKIISVQELQQHLRRILQKN